MLNELVLFTFKTLLIVAAIIAIFVNVVIPILKLYL